MLDLVNAFKKTPLIAILRGAKPNEIIRLGQALLEAGVSIVEVPLNSPDPIRSIEYLVDEFSGQMVIGAGTVLNCEQVKQVADVGGQICVSPNTDTDVIQAALHSGMQPIPGYQTPTEAFTAINAGATWLKCFPANIVGAEGIKSHREVIPADIKIIAVGGINAGNISTYLQAGCNGIAAAGSLYQPGRSAQQVAALATDMVFSIRQHD